MKRQFTTEFFKNLPNHMSINLGATNFISWNMSSWIFYKLPRPYCELLERSRKKSRKFFEDIIIDLNQEVWMNEKVAPDAATSRVDSRGAFFKYLLKVFSKEKKLLFSGRNILFDNLGKVCKEKRLSLFISIFRKEIFDLYNLFSGKETLLRISHWHDGTNHSLSKYSLINMRQLQSLFNQSKTWHQIVCGFSWISLFCTISCMMWS